MKRNIAFLVVLAVCLCSCCISIGSEVLQKSNDSSRDKIMQKLKNIRLFDERYESAIPFSFGYQLVILLISGMILDGGQCVQFVLVAMAGFWGSAIVLISRRRWTPSKGDILYIKWGFFPIQTVAKRK